MSDAPLMHLLSFLGSAGFYLPVIAVVFWCVHPRFGARVAVLLAASAALNTLLKFAFQQPRPFWTDRTIIGGEGRGSYGMPSGHAQNAFPTWGYAASRTRRPVAWAGTAVVIVAIGVSRVRLGVHSPAQVAAGWAIGAAFLAVVLLLEPVAVPWWRERRPMAQGALGLAVAAAVFVPTSAAAEASAGRVFPAAWAAAIRAAGGTPEPATVAAAATAAGGLFGVLAGVTLLDRRGWFEPGGSWPRRLARIPVGGAGAGLAAAAGTVGGGHTVLSATVAFASQALLGLWVFAGAPEAFVRLGLATRREPGIPPAVTHAGDGGAGPHL